MAHSFSTVIDRTNTNSLKYDFAAEKGKPSGLLPMWVADMDFRTVPQVMEALERAVRHGIFGYSDSKPDYFAALHDWYASRFDWELRPEWLIKTPGVVYALATAVRALTEKGDAVMIQQPVYYPFSGVVRRNERILVNSPLILEDGVYRMNYEDMEAQIVENGVKLFLLCSPHNPVGRVWTRDELTRLGDICMKHGVIVVSDEIHADFVYPGHRHFVFAGLKPEYLARTITCTAPSKTFNLAGLQASNIFIADPDIRKTFASEMRKGGVSEINVLGLTACQAAYTHGAEWLEELKVYLADNITLVRNFLAERLPRIHLVDPQGTYLLWLDFRRLNLSDMELDTLMVDGAKLWLDPGTMFGPEGSGFQRVNVACPRAILQRALEQLEQAVGDK